MRKSPVFALAAVLAALLVPAVSHAGIPPVGLNVPGGAASAGSLAQVQASGAKYVRAFLIWNGSATPDSATLAAWDTVVNSYSAAGIKPEIVVSGQGGPPSDVNAYASYIGTLAARYGNKVAAWEIWNEEDEAIWWGTPFDAPGATNVAGYAALLKAAYPAVHPYARSSSAASPATTTCSSTSSTRRWAAARRARSTASRRTPTPVARSWDRTASTATPTAGSASTRSSACGRCTRPWTPTATAPSRCGSPSSAGTPRPASATTACGRARRTPASAPPTRRAS